MPSSIGSTPICGTWSSIRQAHSFSSAAMAACSIERCPEVRALGTRWPRNVIHTLYACDFFSVEALGPFGTVRYMVFFVIEVKSRAVEIARIVVDPGEEWMKQVPRNLVDIED